MASTPIAVLTLGFDPTNGQQPPSFTIPPVMKEAVVGRVAYVGINQMSRTVDSGAPAGWTLVRSDAAAGTLAQKMWLWRKVLVAADVDNGVIQFTWAGGVLSRCGAALVVVDGADPEAVVVAALAIPENPVANLDLPRPVSTRANALAVALGAVRYPATATTGVAPPSGWTETVDVVSTNTTNPKAGFWAAWRALGNAAGDTMPAAVATISSATAGAYVLSFSPPVDVVTPPAVVADPVTGLVVQAQGANVVRIAWDPVTDPDVQGITIRRGAGTTVPGPTSGVLVSNPAASAVERIEEGLEPTTQYTFAVYTRTATPTDPGVTYSVVRSGTVTTPAVTVADQFGLFDIRAGALRKVKFHTRREIHGS